MKFVLKLLVSGGLMFLLYRATPFGAIWAVLGNVDCRYFIPIFVLLLVNTVLSALKWRLFLLADDVDIPLAVLVRTYLVGSFYNMFLPSSIGGDYYRIYDVAKRSKDTARSAASVFADRFSGFLAMVTLAVVSSVIVSQHVKNVMFLVGPLLLFFCIIFATVALYKETPIRYMLRVSRLERITAVTRITDKLFLSFTRYGSDRKLLVRIMAISFVFQLLVIFITYLLALSLHAVIPFFYFSAFVPLINLMEALPISIYGLGVRDVGYVFFFGWAGLSEIQTRSIALLFVAMTVCYSLCGGMIHFWRVFLSTKKGSG